MSAPKRVAATDPVLESTVGSGESRSEAVVRAVAAVTEKDTEALPPLYESIPTDALDDIFVPAQRHGLVRFQYCGYHVAVASDDELAIYDTTADE